MTKVATIFFVLYIIFLDSSNEVQPTGERRKRRKKQLSKHDLARGQRDLAKVKLPPRLTRREVKEPAPTCRTFFETSCTTKYVEQAPGKFAGDTTCEKIPVELCGTGNAMIETCFGIYYINLKYAEKFYPLLLFLAKHSLFRILYIFAFTHAENFKIAFQKHTQNKKSRF
jgi:hypothetical protein